VEIDPTYWWAHEDLAVWLATAGEYDNACQHARAAADLNPGSTELNNQLATLLIARKQFDEAIEVLNQTSKLDAHNASTIFLLGAAYHYTGDPTAARRQYDRLQTLDPARAARLGAIIGVAD
jgi:Flp pilus assembly protein TadD